MKKNEITIVGSDILSEEQLAVLTKNSSLGFFAEAGIKEGVTDSPLRAGIQLDSDDIVMRALTIDCIHVTRAVDEKGVQSDFPIISFVELPGYYYTAGSRMMSITLAWAKACGEEYTYTEKEGFTGDRMLPKLNEKFTEHKPTVVFKWKEGKRNKYVDVIILGG